MKSLTTESPYFDPRIPRIALVGRPNVGKSTLFNRLLRKRKSITDPTPGVTRDPVRELWQTPQGNVILVDTGGLSESKEYLDSLITKKSLAVADQADVLVLVLDVEEGLTGDDEEFVKRLRPFSKRLIVAVNKVDNQKREQEIWNFHSLGFERVYGISATHSSGVQELYDAMFALLGELRPDFLASNSRDEADEGEDETDSEAVDFDDEDGESEEPVEELSAGDARRASQVTGDPGEQNGPVSPWDMSLAILGQPNTGKSTLVNHLTNTDLSIVSPVAGTTRDVIEGSFMYKSKRFRILDTAGIRRKARVKEDLEYYSVNRAIGCIEESDVVLLMIDAEKGLVEQDKKIAAQIVKHGKGVILVLNKWDLMENLPNQFNAVSDRVRYLFPILKFAPVMAISAVTGEGLAELLNRTLALQAQLRTRVDTGRLNQQLARWVEETPPPTGRGTQRWKLKYITQASAAPLEFILFVNKSDGFPDAYLGYITNKIRTECRLPDVPLRLILRER